MNMAYIAFRDNPIYQLHVKQYKEALEMIGLKDGDKVESLIGRINIIALEDLMLAAFRMMRYLRTYLALSNLGFTEAHTIPDLFTAIQLEIHMREEKSKMICEEADRYEGVSRSAYAWLKSFDLLRKKPKKEAPPERCWLISARNFAAGSSLRPLYLSGRDSLSEKEAANRYASYPDASAIMDKVSSLQKFKGYTWTMVSFGDNYTITRPHYPAERD